MIRDMIENLKSMDVEIQELRQGKANIESWLAAIVKKYGEIDITFEDLKNSDMEKVKIKNDSNENPYLMTVYYESE